MNLLIRFLLWCARKTPPRVITVADLPYLTRYFIFRRSALTEGMETKVTKPPRWGLYLHRFHRGDQDRELHNHPWRWALSFVLKGGYSEERRESNGVGDVRVVRREVRPWSFNYLTHNDFHRVDLDNGEAWTLFLVGPLVQDWGFWDRSTGSYFPWKKFLGIPETPEVVEVKRA